MSCRVYPSLRVVPVAAVAAFLAGCGGDRWTADRPKRVPVRGTVLYNQQPVEGATVTFSPQGHTHAAVGRTDAHGQFRLRTFDDNDGAVPGEYKITVHKVEASSQSANDDDPYANDDSPPPKQLLPERYGSTTSSDLAASVTDGGENDFTFELSD